MDTDWDGVTLAQTITEDAAQRRTELADAARDYRWDQVFARLAAAPDLANATRLGGTSRYAPLHQAAHAGASRDVVDRLIALGAWRTLQNSRGERPVDVAVKRGHHHLVDALQPRYQHRVPLGVLLKIQGYFHEVIRERSGELVEREALRLPELESLLELEEPRMWFAVPGMYGGFSYRLGADGVEAMLVAESWCRVVEGSGQRHEITSAGARLVAEGFA